MNKEPYLSVIIPCYNEEVNLERGVLEEVENYLKKQDYPSEVIISDDGSTDKSKHLVEKFVKYHPRFKLLKNPHAGKPYAVKAGIMKAKGEIVLFTDMDQSTPINQAEKLLPYFARNKVLAKQGSYFKKGFVVVIGSRGQKRVGFSLFRRLASNIFRLIRQSILLKEIVDTQCGFKAFKNRVAKDLFARLLIFKEGKQAKGWRVGAFDAELLFVAQKRGYKIAEVPVNWEDKDVARGKQRKFFQESKEMLREILRVKLNDLRGYYD